MDENRLRQQICQAAQQLWMRGLIVGDAGVVTIELHRRRFLTTPPGLRRANLQPDDIICVDMGGLSIQGGPGLDDTDWRLHRAAYKSNLDESGQPIVNGKRRTVNATIVAEPPIAAAVMRMAAADQTELTLPGWEPVPLLRDHDEQTVIEAVQRSPLVAVHTAGVLATGHDLAAALNWLERFDHAARIALATGSRP